MEVTKSDLKSKLPFITTAINEATFLSIDGEFTGLNNGKNIHGFDTPEEIYQKVRKGAVDFLLVQFGLSAFKHIPETDSYEEKSFNFYVFPHPHGRQGPDVRFLCQSSSIDFLISAGFDFNKLFTEGIPYLLPSDELKLREELQQKHQQAKNVERSDESMKSPIAIPDEHKDFVSNMCTKVEEFLKTDETVFQLEPCNAFVRKLLYQQLKSRFSSGIYLETKIGENTDRFIVVTKADEQKMAKMDQEKMKLELEELDDAFGFSKIIKLITDSGKLVVGHNMLLDICHVIHQFSSSLPSDYEEFKSLANCVFPRLLDTKLMGSMQPFKEKINSTRLSDLRRTLQGSPFTRPTIVAADESSSYLEKTDLSHEAGYDAFITGICFITMTNYLVSLQSKKETNPIPNCPLLQPFMNKMFLMRVQDIPYMDLCGTDVKPSRDHVFYVTFPKQWKTSDLCQLFSPFGSVYVAWLDDASAFVALNKRDQSDVVMKTLTQSDTYHVMSYDQYSTRNNENHKKSSALTHKRRLSPETSSRNSGKKRKETSESYYSEDTDNGDDDDDNDDATQSKSKSSVDDKKSSSKNSHSHSRHKKSKPMHEKAKRKKMFEEPDWD